MIGRFILAYCSGTRQPFKKSGGVANRSIGWKGTSRWAHPSPRPNSNACQRGIEDHKYWASHLSLVGLSVLRGCLDTSETFADIFETYPSTDSPLLRVTRTSWKFDPDMGQ